MDGNISSVTGHGPGGTMAILVINVDTTNGLYTIMGSGDRVYVLASLIERGSIVKFPTKYHCQNEVGLHDLFGWLNNENMAPEPWMRESFWPIWVQVIEHKKFKP